MADEGQEALRALTGDTRAARTALSEFTNIALDLAERSTSVLSGVWGGVAAILAAYVATVPYTAFSMTTLGPLAAMVGIPTGILIARLCKLDTGGAALDYRARLMKQNREAAHQLIEEMALLPKGTPAKFKAGKYQLLAEIDRNYAQLLGPGAITTDPARAPQHRVLNGPI